MPQFFLGYPPPWVPAVMQPMETMPENTGSGAATVGDLEPAVASPLPGTPVDALESPSDQAPVVPFATPAESATP